MTLSTNASLRQGLRAGLITTGIIVFLNLIGLPLTLGEAVVPLFAVGTALLALAFLRDTYNRQFSLTQTAVNGLLVGAITGIVLALVTWLIANLQADGVEVNKVFAQLLPEHTVALTGVTRQDLLAGTAVVAPALMRLALYLTAGGFVGGLLTRLFTDEAQARLRPSRSNARWLYWLNLASPFLAYGLFLLIESDLVDVAGSDENIVSLVVLFIMISLALVAMRRVKSGVQQWVLGGLLLLIVIVLTQQADPFQTVVLSRIAIFVTVGLGLNIVIGYSGLLALGYAAFFAIGAYTYGLLAAPDSFVLTNVLNGFEGINFWWGIPIVILVGLVTGVLLGLPVMRLRGDYLAIVTLGFGEIIRLILLNARDVTGGPGGVLNIPAPVLFGNDLGSPNGILYLGLGLALLAALISHRLRDSRIGRAWIAIREDETVAQAMGINLVAVKLLAFAIGSALAALGGHLYAAQQVNIFPDNFTLLVSIDILSLVIIGGLGSIEGMVLGSIALIGLPEILRGVDEYRIVAFGALLVAMMILRPQGLLPSARRERELADTELSQDAWLQKAGVDPESPDTETAPDTAVDNETKSGA